MSTNRENTSFTTVPEILESSWERRGTPAERRLEEAQHQAADRISQIVILINRLTFNHPEMQGLLKVMSGDEYDKDLVEADARRIVEQDHASFTVFTLLEKTIARDTSINAHEYLERLELMIGELKAKLSQ